MPKCSLKCLIDNIECTSIECRHWINYGDDKNCCLIAVHRHGSMTLREIADRIGVTFARIKQIETIALNKIKKHMKNENPFF